MDGRTSCKEKGKHQEVLALMGEIDERQSGTDDEVENEQLFREKKPVSASTILKTKAN